MEFKGTKGNWELKKLTNRIIIGNSIADVWGFDAHINSEVKEEMEANALLISKAPEMLEMLKKHLGILYDIQMEDSGDNIYVKNLIIETRQLIKQATEL